MTIKQILDAEEIHSGSEIIIDGSEVTRLCFIGQVRNIAKQTTCTTFKLDDGTGTIEAKNWNDTDEPMYDEGGNALQSNKDPIEVGDWAVVNGVIKFSQNNRKNVTTSFMKKVTDKNAINYHLLEATYVHLYLTRGPPASLNNNAAADGNVYGQQQMANPGMNGDGGVNQNRLQGMNAATRKVFTCIKTEAQSNEGLHQHDIASRVGLPIDAVVNACNDLGNQSLIFNTVDDETWAVLEEY